MKIAVSSTGKSLDAPVDPRFGRCPYFVIVETEDLKFDAFDNQSAALGGGAGIQAAQFVISKGIRAVITGNLGPNALRTLSAAGIELFTGQTGTVREVVEGYKTGALTASQSANVPPHYGAGAGRGMGGGRGMGMGGGRGMGRGMRMPAGSVSPPAGDLEASEDVELRDLKEQAYQLSRQMEEVLSRIKKLEEKKS
jgi:predicted Fe-Mo cluster-binding NifX family protein